MSKPNRLVLVLYTPGSIPWGYTPIDSLFTRVETKDGEPHSELESGSVLGSRLEL